MLLSIEVCPTVSAWPHGESVFFVCHGSFGLFRIVYLNPIRIPLFINNSIYWILTQILCWFSPLNCSIYLIWYRSRSYFNQGRLNQDKHGGRFLLPITCVLLFRAIHGDPKTLLGSKFWQPKTMTVRSTKSVTLSKILNSTLGVPNLPKN